MNLYPTRSRILYRKSLLWQRLIAWPYTSWNWQSQPPRGYLCRPPHTLKPGVIPARAEPLRSTLNTGGRKRIGTVAERPLGPLFIHGRHVISSPLPVPPMQAAQSGGHKTLLYGHAILLRHSFSSMVGGGAGLRWADFLTAQSLNWLL